MSTAHADFGPDLVPSLDVRALARRAAVPAALLAVVAGVLVVADGPAQAFAGALGRALDADPRWVLAGAICEILSFGGYVALMWLVGGRASPRLGLRASAEVTFGGAAATRLLPTGGAGGAALTIWAFRRAGLGPRDATRTLLAFLSVLYAVFLGAIAVSGGVLALGLAASSGPLALSAIPAAGAALAIAAGLALAARRPAPGRDAPAPAADGRPSPRSRAARLRAGLGETPATIGAGVRDALSVIASGDLRLLGALAWWGFDLAVLWTMLQALGDAPALAIVALGYFVGQVANTLPLPGAASGGMVGVLLAFGVEADLALASVLAYRAVAVWLPAPLGLAALGGLRRRVAAWGGDAPSPVPA
jgi:uncharacterized membrane protein YbhN (UPF0104 family)